MSALWVGAAITAIATSCGSPEARQDVAYDDRFGKATTMDVYLPEDDGAPHPGVLLVHGGSWNAGSKGHYGQVARRFSRSGYVAATINYRLDTEGRYPKAIQDCMCALTFLRVHAAEYRLDPNRIAAWGYSAGGHLVALMGVAGTFSAHAPDCAAAKQSGVPVGGPTAVVSPPNAVIAGAANPDFRDDDDRSVIRDFLGGTKEERPDVYRDASPISHVGPNKPPFLFVLGGADISGQDEQVEAMRDGLRASGNVADMLVIDGGGHLLNHSPSPGDIHVDEADVQAEAWPGIIDFLERTVGRGR